MKQAQAVSALHQKITAILGSAGIPTDVSTAIEQEFTQCINDIDKAPRPKKRAAAAAKRPAKRAAVKKPAAAPTTKKRRKARR